jgi:hypothetical protein
MCSTWNMGTTEPFGARHRTPGVWDATAIRTFIVWERASRRVTRIPFLVITPMASRSAMTRLLLAEGTQARIGSRLRWP